MLRAYREHVVPPVLGPSIGLRPRVAVPSPVFKALPEPTIAARGHLPNGAAAALIATPSSVCLVSADRAGRGRVRRFTLREVLVVEEHRTGNACELQVVTASGVTLTMVGVEVAQAWSFCRELRELIITAR